MAPSGQHAHEASGHTDPPSSAAGEPARDGIEALWGELHGLADRWAQDEPVLATWIHHFVLGADGLQDSLARRLAHAFAGDWFGVDQLRELFQRTLAGHPEIERAAHADLLAIREGDPATEDLLTPFLFFKGFAAVTLHRIAHVLWHDSRHPLALALQQRSALVAGIDIHPAARIGSGVLMDHAGGIVVGETAVISDDVVMFHNVTLGGTGRERGDRHPKVGRNAFIGAGATLLGNIRVGNWTRVGAGSVVLRDVPDWSIAVGVPARVSAVGSDDDWPDPRWRQAAVVAGGDPSSNPTRTVD